VSGPGARLDWIAQRGGALHGTVRVPGDKSISHRAIMFGSLADGTTRITGFLEGEDTLHTAAAFTAMGVAIEKRSEGERVVHGVGLHALRKPAAALDMGNAGTGMRLIAGVLAGQRFASTLIGDASLSRRPMKRVIDPLTRMGAQIAAQPGGLAPLNISPAPGGLNAIDYDSPVASAQVKSCVLLAGLYANGTTRVREPHRTRDHTERMLRAFGVSVHETDGWIGVHGGSPLTATDIVVPADFSSAAFFLVAASIIPGSDITLENVGVNPLRTGLLDVLRDMGADIVALNPRLVGGEPVADLRVRHAELRGTDVPESAVADMIDEFPAFFVAAAAARGISRVRGAAELRVKESDRLAAMATVLRTLGITVDETPDGATIHGGMLTGGRVDSLGDHRIAMASAVAAQIAASPVTIADCDNVATSFPGFVSLAGSCGLVLRALG
jgi:3-phosphoshikimate 1-carboxyvinyltransferase